MYSMLAWCTALGLACRVSRESREREGDEETNQVCKIQEKLDSSGKIKVNKAENKKLVEKLNKTKSWLF